MDSLIKAYRCWCLVRVAPVGDVIDTFRHEVDLRVWFKHSSNWVELVKNLIQFPLVL